MVSNFLPPPSELLGTLRMDETLDYYDGPILFTVRDTMNRAFLAMSVEDTETAAIYLYVPMSDERLHKVRAGRVSLREAFRDSETGTALIVTLNFDDAVGTTVAQVPIADVPERYFSDANQYLTDEVQDATPFSRDEFALMAERNNRELLAIELDGVRTLENAQLPADDSGAILTEFQDFARVFTGPNEYSLVGLQAASAVILLTPSEGDGLFPTAQVATAGIMATLDQAGRDDFAEYVASMSSRHRTRLRDFLAAVSDSGANLTALSASSSGAVKELRLTSQKMRDALNLLRQSNAEESQTFNVTGHLIGINHKRRSFHVLEPSSGKSKARSYAGKFDPAIDIEGIRSGETVLYRFTIVRDRTTSEDDPDAVTYRNTVTDMALVHPELDA